MSDERRWDDAAIAVVIIGLVLFLLAGLVFGDSDGCNIHITITHDRQEVDGE